MSSTLAFMERAAPWTVLWFAIFTFLHALRIVRRIARQGSPARDNAGLTELAGLPLTLLQPVCFVKALLAKDLAGMALFAWWGPGFVLTLAAVGIARARHRRIDWSRLARPISWACKLYYLAYVAAFFFAHTPTIAFAFSAWILNDQIEKLFMSLDADRTRRTFADLWIPRILYPAGLLLPWFVPSMPYRFAFAGYGVVLLVSWLAGLGYVIKKGKFFAMPEDPSLLRNMVYFPRLRTSSDA